jgi:hypothetical protein
MVKSQWRDGTIAFSPSYSRANTIVTIVSSYYRAIVFSSSYHRVFAIVPSRFHHRFIVFSLSYHRSLASYHRVFTIVSSPFHHRTIAFSPSCHRVSPSYHRLPMVMRYGTFSSTIYASS